MPTSGNVGGFQTPNLTPPPGEGVQVETYADVAKQNSQQAQMPPVYYGGKTGSVAFMADKVLSGWLAGTKIAHERKAKKMADEVGASKTGLDYIGQAYRAAVESGDEKKIGETKAALSEAYNDYLNKAEKYAMPEDGGGKKGAGGKIKEGLKRVAQGGENPHLNIAHSTLEIMRKTDPTQLYGPSKQEQQQSKLLDLQTSEMEKDVAAKNRWEKMHESDPAKWSAQDKQFNEFYEYEHFGKSKEQQTKDELLTKITGNQQLSPQEKQLAEQFGFAKPDQTTAQIRTVADPKTGQPRSQIVPVTVTPDGKVTAGTPINLPGSDYVGPNQAQLAGQVINSQMSALVKWGGKMHPEWDPKTPEGQKALTSWALTTLYPPTAGTINWADKNEQMDVMNRALGSVLKHHQKEYKDSETGKPMSQNDQMADAILGNVVSTTEDGRYAYLPSLGAGQTSDPGWWGRIIGRQGETTWGGMTREQLNDQERKFQAELRAELKKQNPKMTDTQIDSLVPHLLSRGQAQAQAQPGAMEPPPGAGAPAPRSAGGIPGANQYSQLAPPPAQPGSAWYRIQLPDGTVTNRQMTQEYADALQSQGVKVQPLAH